MDGLMLNTEALGKWAWQQAAEEVGYKLTDQVFFQMIGLSVVASNQVLIENLGKDFPLEKAREKRIHYGNIYLKKFGLQTQPGLLQLLDYLDSKNITYTVATSTIREVAEERLSLTGIRDRFNILTTGDEVKNGKPAPDIFLLAAEKLNLDAAKCIVLEDSENGIRAAHAAGCLPLMVPDLKQPSDEVKNLAHEIFPSLHEVKDFLLNDLN